MNKYNPATSARHPVRMKIYAELIRKRSIRNWDKKLNDNNLGDKGAALADLKDMYYNPESYDILPFYHNYTPDGSWVYTAYFIPSYIGAVTERGTDANLVERQLLDNRGYCLW